MIYIYRKGVCGGRRSKQKRARLGNLNGKVKSHREPFGFCFKYYHLPKLECFAHQKHVQDIDGWM